MTDIHHHDCVDGCCDWTDDDRARFIAYASEGSPEKLDELGESSPEQRESMKPPRPDLAPKTDDELTERIDEQIETHADDYKRLAHDCVTHHYCECTAKQLQESAMRIEIAEERIKQLEADLAVADEHVRSLVGERDALQPYASTMQERIDWLREERDRLISANDTLVLRIDDMTQSYALEDTCPRVQCQTTSKRLKDECNRLRMERDDALNQRQAYAAMAEADYEELWATAHRHTKALERIAGMPTTPRPDGTHNHCREALIDIAQDALNDHTDAG